ncbi:MAG: hypothetical protein NW204_02595 [Xanthomonadaceae bacterium]|nr:hypothetical protein [Xanthomonadaceae bacterium]
MYSKMRNTAFGMFAALTFAATSALVGEPVPAAANLTATVLDGAVVVSTASEPTQAPATRKRQSVRLNLAMPYYSFGRLLPRRES